MANIENLRVPSSEEARAMQRKSAAKRSQNIKERKLLMELLIERTKSKDLEEMLDNLIERAKNTDKGFEVYRDTIGEKPTERIDTNVNLSYEEKLKQVADDNEY
jgi:hypothetical protein